MSHEAENERYAEECRYLARLLETQGNRDVPRGSVRSYFAVQAAGARRAQFHCLAYTLESIADSGLSDAEAIVALRAHAAALSSRLLTAPRRHVRAARERELALMGAALNLATDAADAAVAYPISADGHVECSAIATEADALWNLADRGGLTVAGVSEAEGRVGALRERLAAWEGK